MRFGKRRNPPATASWVCQSEPAIVAADRTDATIRQQRMVMREKRVRVLLPCRHRRDRIAGSIAIAPHAQARAGKAGRIVEAIIVDRQLSPASSDARRPMAVAAYIRIPPGRGNASAPLIAARLVVWPRATMLGPSGVSCSAREWRACRGQQSPHQGLGSRHAHFQNDIRAACPPNATGKIGERSRRRRRLAPFEGC